MDTIGQVLKKARENKHRTLSEVAHAIRATTRYVEAIEAGNFQVFPAPIYALGFIRLYADFVGEDFSPLEKVFRELEEERVLEDKLPGKKKCVLEQDPGRKHMATPTTPEKRRQSPAAPGETASWGVGLPAGLWPAALNKIKWQALGNHWASLSSVRLPVDTWKNLLAITGMTILLIVAASVFGWYLLSRPGAAPDAAATQWLVEPPAPYLADE